MIGFSIPIDRNLLLLTYDGLKQMHLSKPITISTVDDSADPFDLYDPDTAKLRHGGKTWDLVGLHTGRPILERPNGDVLVLDEKGLRVSVTRGGKEIWSSDFENFSGDWVAATFSPDDSYIILGCPYDFDFRVWERHPDA